MIRVFLYHSQLNRLQFLQKAITAYFQQQKHTYRLTACGRYEDAAAYLRGDEKGMTCSFCHSRIFPRASVWPAACGRKIPADCGFIWTAHRKICTRPCFCSHPPIFRTALTAMLYARP